MKNAIPLRPDYGTASDRALSFSVAKAATAMGRAAISGGHTSAARTDDPVAQKIIQSKGAVVPSSTSTETVLRQTVIPTLGAIIGPQSAIGQLLPRFLNVSIEGLYGATIPSIVVDPDALVWTSEGAPISVKDFSFDSKTLTTKKFGIIVTATRETVEQTSAESVIRELLARNLSLGLEKKMFSTDAAGAGPAGLLFNKTPIDPTAGGDDHAMLVDVGNLAAAVFAVSSDLFFICGPGAGAKLITRAPWLKFPVAISSAVADDSIICLSPSLVAIAGGQDPPRVDVSVQAVLHEDTTPLPLTTAATASFPIRSLFSTDCVAIRLRADVDFALRSSSGIAVINSVTW